MIETFLYATIGAILVGVILWLWFNRKKEPSRSCSDLPEWMKDKNISQSLNPGDYVLNLCDKYPYAKYGELGKILKKEGGCYWVSWNFDCSVIGKPINQSQVIFAYQVELPKEENKHDKELAAHVINLSNLTKKLSDIHAWLTERTEDIKETDSELNLKIDKVSGICDRLIELETKKEGNKLALQLSKLNNALKKLEEPKPKKNVAAKKKR